MSDEKLAKEIGDYQELAKQNPGVDVNMLMMNALANEDKLRGAGKSYKWPYMIAVSLPPLGLLFAAKYYFSGDEGDRQAMKICILLTAVSLLSFVILGKVLFSTAGVTPEQIETINPAQVQQELQ